MVERYKTPLGNITGGVEGTTKPRRITIPKFFPPSFLLFPSLHFVPYLVVEITYKKVGWVMDNKPVFSLFLI